MHGRRTGAGGVDGYMRTRDYFMSAGKVKSFFDRPSDEGRGRCEWATWLEEVVGDCLWPSVPKPGVMVSYLLKTSRDTWRWQL